MEQEEGYGEIAKPARRRPQSEAAMSVGDVQFHHGGLRLEDAALIDTARVKLSYA